MVILGIDPGYAIVGWGVVRFERGRYLPLDFGAVITPAGMPFGRRLELIYDGFTQVLQQHHPDAASVEKLYFQNNKTTGIDVAQARGVTATLTPWSRRRMIWSGVSRGYPARFSPSM